MDIWGLGHDNFKSIVNGNVYDLIINLENYDTTGGVPDFSNCKSKKFFGVIDPHVRTMEPYNAEFNRNKYDLKLQAVKTYLDDKSVWFPNSCDDEIVKPLNIKKEYNFGFCGGMNEKRIKFFNLLRTKGDIKIDNGVLGDDMVKAINSYFVQINTNAADDVNYRTFETCGCKTLLITNYNDQHKELGFIHSENFFEYNDLKHLLYVIRDVEKLIKENPEKIRNITNSGYDLIKQKHIYFERAKHILNLVKGI